MELQQVKLANAVLGLCLGAVIVASCGGGGEGTHFIRGSARLPDCDETPSVNLDGSAWYNAGTLTIQTEGCDYDIGEMVEVCGLRWDLTQRGGEVDLLVDDEYRIKGRLCSDTLHLEGGWWAACRQ